MFCGTDEGRLMDLSVGAIRKRIYSVRGNQVVLDNDLAEFYETKTKALNQAVRRNQDRFPVDFWFQLTQKEQTALPRQLGAEKQENRGGRRTLPYGFTQEGVAMLSGVLNSDRAVQVNILILRAFVQLRQVSDSHLDLAKRFDQLESKCDEQFKTVLEAVQRPIQNKPSNHPTCSVSKGGSTQRALENTSRDGILKERGKGRNGTLPTALSAKIDRIQTAVAEYYGLKVQDLGTTTRIRGISLPRQVAIYFIRKYTGVPFSELGKYFGGKDHTTVLHAYNKIDDAMNTDKAIGEAVESLQQFLSQESGKT